MLHAEFSANPVPRISWQSIQLGDLIGNGSFGDVYRGLQGGRDVAVKVLQIKTLPAHLAQDFDNETRIMWQCKFDNILDLYGICTEPGHYSIIMENMSRGSLSQFLRDPQQEISKKLLWQIAIDTAEGLAYLHAKDILHRDLKSNNILLNEKYCAKISDFGLSKLKLEIKSTSTTSTARQTGTIRWRAPELFKRGAIASKASDIYSYGMILWELVTRKLPFNDAADETTVMGWIKDGEQENIPEDCPEVWKEIITSCWSAPENRPQAKEIVARLKQAQAILTSTSIVSSQEQLRDTTMSVSTYEKSSKEANLQPVPDISSHVEKIPEMEANISKSVEKQLATNSGGKGGLAIFLERHSVLPEPTPPSNAVLFSPAITINPQYLAKFLKHIGFGEQDEAEAMLKENRDLALIPGDLTDCAGRQFKQITGFQYTVWALDWHMWEMLRKYIPNEKDAKNQLIRLETGAWIREHGPQVNLQNLINSLQKYINYFHKWNDKQLVSHWCQQVGGAQLMLPAHVINEYSRPDRAFSPCPSFQESNLPRVGLGDWYKVKDQKFAWGRANSILNRVPSGDGWILKAPMRAAESDHVAVSALVNTREKQRVQLFSSLDLARVNPTIPTVTMFSSSTSSPCHSSVETSNSSKGSQNQDLAEFLKHIGFGEQDEAEAMLKENRDLALMPGTLIDCAKRCFKQITGFQYAIWALDWHMWEMLRKYMTEESVKTQLMNLETGAWVKEYGIQANWQKLINALQKFNNNYNHWNDKKCQKHWVLEVGGAQLLLPAHVINEYTRKDRLFCPCPTFNDTTLPRADFNILDWYKHHDQPLARNYAWLNKSWSGNNCVIACNVSSGSFFEVTNSSIPPYGNIGCGFVERDYVAVSELFRIRMAQRLQFISSVTQPPIQVIPLDKFLKHIGFGEQDEAEEMLKINPNLALISGDLTDCAGRHFKQISGLQYAVWALDWHMWEMLRKYMPEEIIKKQLMCLETSAWIKEHGMQVDWQNLIDALQNYITYYDKWDEQKCESFWCKQVGEAQLLLPAHVINEYCRSDRSFSPCPEFKESILPRTGISDWNFKGGYALGRKFAWMRREWSVVLQCKHGASPMMAELRPPECKLDLDAISVLFECRRSQRIQFISSFGVINQLAIAPNSATSSISSCSTSINNPGLFFALPKISSDSGDVSPQILAKFLKHVGFGEQNEAEAMLKETPNLTLTAGNLIDCAGRNFKHITGFQYAVWALDWHMWEMVKKYMQKEAIQEQLSRLNTETWINDHGTQISWLNLISSLQTYVDQYNSWTNSQRSSYWCSQVGGTQLLLPAHVIQEYFRPDRSFYPCPKFNEMQLPRLNIIDECEWFTDSSGNELGKKKGFAWARYGRLDRASELERNDPEYAIKDFRALQALLELRSKQRTQLISSIVYTQNEAIKKRGNSYTF